MFTHMPGSRQLMKSLKIVRIDSSVSAASWRYFHSMAIHPSCCVSSDILVSRISSSPNLVLRVNMCVCNSSDSTETKSACVIIFVMLEMSKPGRSPRRICPLPVACVDVYQMRIRCVSNEYKMSTRRVLNAYQVHIWWVSYEYKMSTRRVLNPYQMRTRRATNAY